MKSFKTKALIFCFLLFLMASVSLSAHAQGGGVNGLLLFSPTFSFYEGEVERKLEPSNYIRPDGSIGFGEVVWGKSLVHSSYNFNDNSPSFSILPSGSLWFEVRDWKQAKSKNFKLTLQSAFEIKTTEITYSIRYLFGGQYKGKGKYISGLMITPVEVRFLQGVKIDFQTSIVSITNIGTDEDPIVHLTIELILHVKSLFYDKLFVHQFNIDGNGNFVSNRL